MISGSIVALVTPMQEDGSLDWDSLDALVDWHIAMGTNGIVPVGTTGESATVDVKEHAQIIKRVVNQVNGRLPVIAGTGANATLEAIELTQMARDAGADACLLVTPYYNKPTQEGLYQHYKLVAETVDIPQILYNVPGRTACDMLAETVARLSALKNVIGIKEATGDVNRTLDILELCESDVVVYSGDDATAVDLILNGARGTISVTANVAPDQMAEVCQVALAGDADRANDLNSKLMGLHKGLFVESNPIPVKWALHQMGKIGKGIRLPLTELSGQYHDIVRDALAQAGIGN
ncbi:MAG: 4-hydroxy-tetrahydrodipicolinate synthase [Pseudomonadales bacterium]|jgi:4-hydroxy-tetrahydrodipicolinate synthase|nr:4-hydroxy-tetrahydrodipicolinate synthase [Pseudomonadales bacterium]MDP7145255.1 4-hydroxy-tetrahydrodipicolinate synthase [Pseudomonadales bacterium]MDP7358347.1 4-hydroxy-tetrahydrodipicolinate synthase [Pseudomonadales bacterium]MDP7596861.1 4-hydroxy-tetrahydrodipicolinate synthase [Pseudomonadales bacterium]HJN51561.1 4-hydroxy-tetrahydrodipicolinate synthase [Pseudomonadales bacterium]|tara:strand:- start:6417 stop:7295 length:879 start_codon:yes stop_codon:yes gene_type:complete